MAPRSDAPQKRPVLGGVSALPAPRQAYGLAAQNAQLSPPLNSDSNQTQIQSGSPRASWARMARSDLSPRSRHRQRTNTLEGKAAEFSSQRARAVREWWRPSTLQTPPQPAAPPTPTAPPQTQPRRGDPRVPLAQPPHQVALPVSPRALTWFRPPARKNSTDNCVQPPLPPQTAALGSTHTLPPLQLGPTRLLTQRHINFVKVFIAAGFRMRRRRGRRGSH